VARASGGLPCVVLRYFDETHVPEKTRPALEELLSG